MPTKLSDDEMQALLVECRRQQAFAGVESATTRLDGGGEDGLADDAVGSSKWEEMLPSS